MDRWAAAADEPFRQLAAFSFLTTLLRSFFVFWTAKFLVDIGMGNAMAVLNAAAFPIVGVIGTIALGYYTDRYAKGGNRFAAMWVMLTGLVGCLFGIGLLVPYEMTYANVIVVLLGMSGFFLLAPYSMPSGCLALDLAGARGSGSATGMLDGVGYLGGALAAWVTGVVSDRFGWDELFLGLSGIALLAVISAYRMSITYQREYSGPSAAPAGVGQAVPSA